MPSYPAGLLNLILWSAARPNDSEQPMNPSTPDAPAGLKIGSLTQGSSVIAWETSLTPRDRAVAAVEAALRDRRAAHAAYGAALISPDYHLPQAERDARYAGLRAAIAAAQATLDAALDTLEALL